MGEDTDQTNNALPVPPVLPQSLLNLIGDYGSAKADRNVSSATELHLWKLLIDGIKAYAADWAELIAAAYREVHGASATPSEEDVFLGEVRTELRRAQGLFPGDRIMTLAMAEEFGELVKAVLDEPASKVRKEAVQAATMAARVVLDGDSSVSEWRAAKGLDPIGSKRPRPAE